MDESDSYADLLRKLNMSPNGSNSKTLKKVITEYNLDETQLNKNRCNLFKKIKESRLKSGPEYTLKDIFDGKHPNYQSSKLLERLIKENYKERKCERCGITEWMGEKITFHLHHKDGEHTNNKLDNLEILCPNCHSQTNNFGGKSSHKINSNRMICPFCKKKIIYQSSLMCRECYNKERVRPKVSKEELFEILKTNTYASAAELLGVDSKLISRWHKYYVNKERKNGNMMIGSDKAPPREILKQKIKTIPFSKIGEEYGVQGNTIKKWCDVYHLPRHKKIIQQISDEEWEKI